MIPDINTKFITLIGTPLSQSFASRMQNAAYRAAGLNMQYFYTEADQSHLGEIIAGIKAMPSFIGCAVTKPNKIHVLPYLDELDPFCEKMGASNTVVKLHDGRLRGYNTDGEGFYRSLMEEGDIHTENSTFFCFGAGGAARAMCSVLAWHGAKKIYITDIDSESSHRLANDINLTFRPIAVPVDFGDLSNISDSDVVMNATGVGMGKSIGRSPLPAEKVTSGKLYFDACYNPQKTQFLINAEEKGGKIINGLAMSLYQGVEQIRLWTGIEPPVDAMRSELLKILGESHSAQ